MQQPINHVVVYDSINHTNGADSSSLQHDDEQDDDDDPDSSSDENDDNVEQRSQH